MLLRPTRSVLLRLLKGVRERATQQIHLTFPSLLPPSRPVNTVSPFMSYESSVTRLTIPAGKTSFLATSSRETHNNKHKQQIADDRSNKRAEDR
jgi:hypothetical protein